MGHDCPLFVKIETFKGSDNSFMLLPNQETNIKWLVHQLLFFRFVIKQWTPIDTTDEEQIDAIRSQEHRYREGKKVEWLDPPINPKLIFHTRRGLKPNPIEKIVNWEGVEGALLVDVDILDGRNQTWLLIPMISNKKNLRRIFSGDDVVVTAMSPFNKKSRTDRTLLLMWASVWAGKDRFHPGPPPSPPPIKESWLGMLLTGATTPTQKKETPSKKKKERTLHPFLQKIIPINIKINGKKEERNTPPPPSDEPFKPGERGKCLHGVAPIGMGRRGDTIKIRSLPKGDEE
jgi:hypothetical protein